MTSVKTWTLAYVTNTVKLFQYMSMNSASSLLDHSNNSQVDSVTDGSQEKKAAGGKRRKTFTGCWTCRERHVKCDEQRPSCKRCVAGNFTCQGYNTRLTWLTATSQRASKSSGRSRPVFRAGASVGSDIRTASSACPAPRTSEQRFVPKRGRLKDQHSTNTIHWDQEDQDFDLWPNVDNSSWPPGAEHIMMPPNWYTNSQQQVPTTAIPIFGPFDKLYIPRIGSPMKPFEVPAAAARERELISHWSTNLADKLVPFRSPVNPFLTVVCPMVLEGSRISRTKSTCTVALFHAVCAISAAHQANLRALPSEDGLIEHHKQLSFQHLMKNMDRTDHDERMACLATLCLWILIHFVTGTPGAWREVTKVTRDLLERISSETWGQSTTAALTYQSFSTSFALIQAQYLGRREPLAPLEISLPGLDMVKSQSIPIRSLDLISSFNAKLARGTVLAPEELDQLEIEFALSTPDPSTDFDAGNAGSALLHHHRFLFYYASMIYFRTNSGRRGPEEEIQNLVATCLDHMEQIDLLQKDANPKTWIYAVVAFEAASPELRQRARCLFFKRMSSGIATWDMLLRAVEEIWKRRDATPPGFLPEPWTRTIAGLPEFDVVLY